MVVDSGDYTGVLDRKAGGDLYLELVPRDLPAPGQVASSFEQPTSTPPPPSAMSPTAIVVTATPSPVSTPHRQCPGAVFPPRLTIGQRARVIVFQLALRESPAGSRTEVQNLARDRIVDVLDGPACADEMWWWKVYCPDLDAQGWVAEADHENYYLEPVE